MISLWCGGWVRPKKLNYPNKYRYVYLISSLFSLATFIWQVRVILCRYYKNYRNILNYWYFLFLFLLKAFRLFGSLLTVYSLIFVKENSFDGRNSGSLNRLLIAIVNFLLQHNPHWKMLLEKPVVVCKCNGRYMVQ